MPSAVTEAYPLHCVSACLRSPSVLPSLILEGTHLQLEPELKSPGASRSTACIVLGLCEAVAVAMRVSEGLISYALFLVPMHSASFTLKS